MCDMWNLWMLLVTIHHSVVDSWADGRMVSTDQCATPSRGYHLYSHGMVVFLFVARFTVSAAEERCSWTAARRYRPQTLTNAFALLLGLERAGKLLQAR